MSSRISPLVFESRLPVGSSAKTIVGLLTSARPIATRCCCPPESSEGRWSRRFSSPILPISSATHFLSGFTPAIARGSTTFSSAFNIGSRLKNWKMNPMCCRRSPVSSVSFSFEIFVPAMLTSPLVGLSRPARMCIRVDFPDPDGPITAVRFPSATSSETPRSASTAVSPWPYRRDSSCAATTDSSPTPSRASSWIFGTGIAMASIFSSLCGGLTPAMAAGALNASFGSGSL